MELENETPDEEDGQSDNTDDDDFVAPSHVARDSAAGIARTDSGGITSWQVRIAPISGSSAVGDGRGNNNANRLPNAQKSHKETSVLGKEFKRDGCIDWNITPKADG